jgi:hypothetical protein
MSNYNTTANEKSKEHRNLPAATTVDERGTTYDAKREHFVHSGDKQPTELREPKKERDYKLRDDDKDYEFKPRTEYAKTKESELKAWEEYPPEHHKHDRDHDDHKITDHGIKHDHDHGRKHDHDHGIKDDHAIKHDREHHGRKVHAEEVRDVRIREEQIMSEEVVSKRQRSEAQDLLYLLQALLVEGKNPGKDVITEALLKAERLTVDMSRQRHLDAQTRKTLEDISDMLTTANRMGRNKGFAERLQNIALLSHRALEANRDSELIDPNSTEFINNWRPVFYLIMNSRQFRDLLIDCLRIIWRIAYLYEDIIEDESETEVDNNSTEHTARVIIEDIETKGAPDMTDAEWDNLQLDIQKVLFILAKEPTYRQGIERIFLLLDGFRKSMDEGHPSGHIYEDDHGRQVVAETEALVASFSGRASMEEFEHDLRKLIAKIQRNETMRKYLSEVKHFILKPKSEDTLESKEFRLECKHLATRGRLLTKEFREDVNLKPFLRSASIMMDNIKNDEFLQLLRHHAGIIKSDLSYIDSEGTVQVDTDMLSSLQTILLPLLADTLKYIPIPRIQSSTKNREYWLDNLILCTHDILPENILFHLETEVTLRDITLQGSHSHLIIELDHLITEFKDVDFYYKKKTFPNMSDSGRVTFRVNASKLVLTYKVVQSPEYHVTRIMEGYASFNISNMDIIFDKSTLKHDVLVPMLMKMFKGRVRSQIEKQVETNLTGFMIKLGDLLTGSITKINKPFLNGIDAARKAMETSRVYEKKNEKIE